MLIELECIADLFSDFRADKYKVFRESKGFDGRESKNSRFPNKNNVFGIIRRPFDHELLSILCRADCSRTASINSF
jgi:hypothetical protein